MVKMPRSLQRSLRFALCALALAGLSASAARAQGDVIPSPRAVIYPGDIIRAEALEEIPAAQASGSGFYALNRARCCLASPSRSAGSTIRAS